MKYRVASGGAEKCKSAEREDQANAQSLSVFGTRAHAAHVAAGACCNHSRKLSRNWNLSHSPSTPHRVRKQTDDALSTQRGTARNSPSGLRRAAVTIGFQLTIDVRGDQISLADLFLTVVTLIKCR